MSHTDFDDDGVPVLSPAMLKKAQETGWTPIQCVFLESERGEPIDTIVALMPFLPRTGDTVTIQNKIWRAVGAHFVHGFVQLDDGENAIIMRPAVLFCPPQSQ